MHHFFCDIFQKSLVLVLGCQWGSTSFPQDQQIRRIYLKIQANKKDKLDSGKVLRHPAYVVLELLHLTFVLYKHFNFFPVSRDSLDAAGE